MVSLGDGDILAELTASNRSLRAQVNLMKNELLSIKRTSNNNNNSSSSQGSSSSSSGSHNGGSNNGGGGDLSIERRLTLETMRNQLSSMNDMTNTNGSVILTKDACQDLLNKIQTVLN